MHKLLIRQVRRIFGTLEAVPPEILPLLELVSDAYSQTDDDRELLERAMDLTSHELFTRNAQLQHDLTARQQAAAALQQSEQRYRLLFERNLAGVYRSTWSGQLLECNTAFLTILGYQTIEEIRAHSTHILYLNSSDRDEFLAQLKTQRMVTNRESRLLRKDGSACWVLENAILLPGTEDVEPILLGTLIDITARRAAEEALRDSEERFRAVFENALDALLILDAAGLCRDANPAAAALLGCAPDQLRGTPLLQWVAAEHESEGSSLLRRLGAATPARGEFQLRGDDGGICDIEYSGTPNVWPGEHLLVLHDISERKRLERQLTHQAFHDMLTGLPNRLLFMDRLDHSLARAKRQGTRVGVLFLDLDNFKVINDSLGHRAGDQLLVEVARCLLRCVPAGHSVARLGGDEFTVIMEDLADADAVRAVADAIAAELRNPIWLEGQRVIVSSSIGIALSMTGTEQAEDLLRHADVAMYAAKNRGKSLYQVFMPAMISGVHDRLALEMELRQGLEQGELCLYYQPIVDLTTLEVGQAEALVRWRHPRRGLVGPNEFIPLAESSGLIMQLGRWVIEEACRQLLRWQHGPARRPVTISVNLSAQQFQDPGLVPDIARILTNWKIAPACLKLELTERVALEDVESTLATLWDLKSLGVRLALDDFGVGYSSLNYLKRYALDTLKLDRSFVQGLGPNREDTAIVRAILAFAQALHLDVVAEGIETVEQLAELRALGCAAGQGFYFAPALPPDDDFWVSGAHFGERPPDLSPTPRRTTRPFTTAPLVYPAKA